MSSLTPNPVKDLDLILLWPVRLTAAGDLLDRRQDTHLSPAEWLKAYAESISKASKDSKAPDSGWSTLEDPFSDSFGFPAQVPAAHRYSSFVYFHPFIQRILFEKDPKRRVMEVLVRTDISILELTLASSAGPSTVRLDVLRVQLYLFSTDLAVMSVHLALPPGSEIHFDLALQLLNESRRVYPPYFKDDGKHTPGECPLAATWYGSRSPDQALVPLPPSGIAQDLDRSLGHVESHRRVPLAPHWEFLLAPLAPVGAGEAPAKLYFDQLGDERAHVVAFLGLAEPHRLDESTHYRLAFLDSPGTGWAYNPDFLLAQEPSVFYDRFWNTSESWMTTRFYVSPANFIMLTQSSDFARNTLRPHIRQHYLFLNLMAVAQKSSMLIIWDRLATLLRDYASCESSQESRKQFHLEQKWMAEDLADYVAIFEFSEISNQFQAGELFRLLRSHMRIPELSSELLTQFQYARGVETGNYEESMAERQTFFSHVAFYWLPVSLALSLFGLSVGTGMFDKWLFDEPPFSTWTPAGPLKGITGGAIVLLLILLASWLIQLIFKMIHGEHLRRARPAKQEPRPRG